MKYKIVKYGDPLLQQKSKEIKEINDEIKQLASDMFDMMYIANGIGLAAVQIGVLKRMFVCEISGKKHVMINPEITSFSNETSIYEEGCLSLPGIGADVERPAKVTVEYTDLKGNRKSLSAKGLLATCIQHEYDHLNGIVFIDRISPEEKIAKANEYRKINTI